MTSEVADLSLMKIIIISALCVPYSIHVKENISLKRWVNQRKSMNDSCKKLSQNAARISKSMWFIFTEGAMLSTP